MVFRLNTDRDRGCVTLNENWCFQREFDYKSSVKNEKDRKVKHKINKTTGKNGLVWHKANKHFPYLERSPILCTDLVEFFFCALTLTGVGDMAMQDLVSSVSLSNTCPFSISLILVQQFIRIS